eukprot:10364620-Lingulodinium_polyedra.AAC.1
MKLALRICSTLSGPTGSAALRRRAAPRRAALKVVHGTPKRKKLTRRWAASRRNARQAQTSR